MAAGGAGESASEDERAIVKRCTPSVLLSSSSESEHEPSARRTTGSRSSARLRGKASKTIRLPSRDEVLEQISPGNTTYTQESIRKLKPRKLVNNFLRERSTYVTERNCELDSDYSILSDFIADDDDDDNDDDGSVSNSDVDEEDNDSNVGRTLPSSGEEANNDSGRDVQSRRKKKGKRVRHRARIASSDNESSDECNHTEKPTSRRKRRKISSGSSERDTCKEENKGCSPSNSAVRPRSSRVQNLAVRQETRRNQVLDSFLQKRQSARLEPKERLERKLQEERRDWNQEVSSELEAHDPWKDCIEDEDDRAFIASDDEVSDTGVHSDTEQLIDVLALKTEPCDEAGDLESGKKGKNTWHRIAVSEGSDETVKRLLADKCPVPIIAAVLEGNKEALEDRVKEDPKCVNDTFRKKTALHFAAINGSIEMVKCLLTVGANPTMYDGNHLPAVAYAADGHLECLELILKQTDINLMKIAKHMEKNEQGFSLLHFAVLGTCDSRVRCLELLFNHDKKTCKHLLDHKDIRGFTPLVCAVNVGQHKCVEALVARGANPHQFQTTKGGNLLHYAVQSASSHMTEEQQDVSLCLRELLPHMKLRIDEVDQQNGFTPLMYACESGNADCAATLLESGASVSVSDSLGTSSLHLAAMIGSAPCVQLLLEFGHRVDCVDRHGWLPLLYANFQARESCVLALMKPKPEQVFVLGNLLRKAENELDKKKTFEVVKNVLVSLANHDAYYTVFNDFIRAHPEMLDEHSQGLLQDTWRRILNYDNKRRWFRRKLSQLREPYAFESGLTLVVDRKNVLGSAMRQLGNVAGRRLRQNSLHVTFQDEPGICTGPKREFYACFCKDVVDTKRTLFTVTDDSQYSPFPNAYFAKRTGLQEQSWSRANGTEAASQASSSSEQRTSEGSDEELVAAVDELESQALGASKRGDGIGRVVSLHLKLNQMNFIGRMVGFAICEDILLDFPLSEPFVKQVLGIQLSHPADLSSFDNELHRNAVVWVLENSVCELELPFSVDVVNPWNKKPVTVMLCEEHDGLLTDENKDMYVKLVSEFMLETSIKDEVAEFTRGLSEVIPRELLSFFTADEFSLLINGVCSIDVEDWKQNTEYHGWQASDDVIKWFWSAVSRLKEEEKALLLKFSTGSPCVPVGGFAALQGMAGTGKFTIVKIGEMNKIPMASTCFNMLKLTEYDQEKELREKLLIAIRHGAEGFSFS